MIGAIRGVRLAAEVKLELVGAILEAKKAKFSITKACEVLMLDSRRLHRWICGKDLDNLTAADFVDEPPVAKVIPNKITQEERHQIIDAATDPDNSHLRHRKLTHHLSRAGKAFVSASRPSRANVSTGRSTRRRSR